MKREDREPHTHSISNYLDTGEAKIIGMGREVAGQRKDGVVFPLRLGIGEMEIDGQRKFVGTVQDISDQHAARTALKNSEQNLRNLTRLSPVGIYRADADGRITYANTRALKIGTISGRGSPTAYLGDDWQDYIYPEDREKFVAEYLAAVKAQGPFAGEYRFGNQSGPIAWVLSQAIPEFDRNKKFVGYVGTLTDITELKLSEQALADSEERFSLAMSDRCLVNHTGS